MFTEDMYNILIINAMRRFMFTCAGTPLALPYQEFTKGMNPLAPSVRKGKRHVRNKAFLGKVHPMKRNDMQKRGKRMEEMTGMWKNPHERRKNGSRKYRIQLLAEAKQS